MKKIISLLMIITFFTGLVYAEKIIMKDGKEYVGNIQHKDDNKIDVDQKEEIIKLNRADVNEIVLE